MKLLIYLSRTLFSWNTQMKVHSGCFVLIYLVTRNIGSLNLSYLFQIKPYLNAAVTCHISKHIWQQTLSHLLRCPSGLDKTQFHQIYDNCSCFILAIHSKLLYKLVNYKFHRILHNCSFALSFSQKCDETLLNFAEMFMQCIKRLLQCVSILATFSGHMGYF